MFHLQCATMGDVSKKIFNLQHRAPAASPRSPLQMFSDISRLSDESGAEVWFDACNNQCYEVPPARTHPTIPVRRAFYRIKNSLPRVAAPTIEEVDAVLSEMAAPVNVQMPEDPSSTQQHQSQLTPRGDPGEQQHNDDGQQQHHDAAEQPHHDVQTPIAKVGDIDRPAVQTPQVCQQTPVAASASANLDGIAELFSTPEQGIISQPPPVPGKRGRRLKKTPVAVSSLRRSKRQACCRLKHLPAEQRAQHVLCRRLGYIKDDLTPAEQAIQEFVRTFKGPMPQFIVASLTAMFRLDGDDISSATAALIRLGGQEAADNLPEESDGF
ncbi:unnamed protein product [Urochloa humidicola]